MYHTHREHTEDVACGLHKLVKVLQPISESAEKKQLRREQKESNNEPLCEMPLLVIEGLK